MCQPSIKVWASFLFAVVCLAAWYFAGRRESHTQREADIAEVAFRRLLEMPDLSHRPNATSVCIANDQQRFDAKFPARFQNRYPAFKVGA